MKTRWVLKSWMEISAKKCILPTSLKLWFLYAYFYIIMTNLCWSDAEFSQKMMVSDFLKMNFEVRKQGGSEVWEVVDFGSTWHTRGPGQIHLKALASSLVWRRRTPCFSVWCDTQYLFLFYKGYSVSLTKFLPLLDITYLLKAWNNWAEVRSR